MHLLFRGFKPNTNRSVPTSSLPSNQLFSLHLRSISSLLLSPNMDQGIRQLARRCQIVFEECRRAEKLSNSEWLENRQSDYNLWVSTMKSTKQGKGSLSHRIRNRPDVSEAMYSFLSALSECLDACFELGEFPGIRQQTHGWTRLIKFTYSIKWTLCI